MPTRGSSLKTEAAEATAAAIASKATQAGAGTAVFGGLTANEFAAFGGLLVAVVGLLVQAYYKRKADKRHAAEHELRMANLRSGHE